MAKRPNPPVNPNEAYSLLSYARQYREAAQELLHSRPHLSPVINALFFHVTELLLKAYLVANGQTNTRTHKVSVYLRECQALGLVTKDRLGLENVVGLLEAGNDFMGFRYFNLNFSKEPDLNWTNEIVGQLEEAVTAAVEKGGKKPPATAAKLIGILHKPQPKA
jgi:hypothetical protein